MSLMKTSPAGMGTVPPALVTACACHVAALLMVTLEPTVPMLHGACRMPRTKAVLLVRSVFAPLSIATQYWLRKFRTAWSSRNGGAPTAMRAWLSVSHPSLTYVWYDTWSTEARMSRVAGSTLFLQMSTRVMPRFSSSPSTRMVSQWMCVAVKMLPRGTAT